MALVTADERMRGGKVLPIADEALSLGGCAAVKYLIVYRRTGGQVGWTKGRGCWMDDVVAAQSDTCEAEPVGAEHPLFVRYASGSTGKPKGAAQHGRRCHVKLFTT